MKSTAYKPLASTVRIGDRVRFRFRAGKPCYLTLVDVGADGSATILFPNFYHVTQARLTPEQWYEIPADEMDFEIITDPPTGQEMVVAIATEAPLPLQQLRLQELSPGIRAMKRPEDCAKLFRVQGKNPSDSSPPGSAEGLLPSTGFAVAYLIAEILD